MTRANAAYGTETNDLLIISLALALCEYTQERVVKIELEGHGREEIFSDSDVSRTVGWFTSIFPVALSIDGNGLSSNIKSLKEQLKKIPNKGIDFGVIKYLNEGFRGRNDKNLRFNYLGDFNKIFDNPVFELSDQDTGLDIGERNHMTSVIDINALIMNNRLKIFATYSKNKFIPETVSNFMNTFERQLRMVIDHCCSKDTVEFTPSDFDSVSISQTELDEIFE
jgi:non-ribosomal peptide synthase protein (TIGR01720 family)